MCICAYIYVRICIRMYTCLGLWNHSRAIRHVYTGMHIRIRYICVCMYICIYVYIHMYEAMKSPPSSTACIYRDAHIYIYNVCMCTYLYMYAYTCFYTCMHLLEKIEESQIQPPRRKRGEYNLYCIQIFGPSVSHLKQLLSDNCWLPHTP